MSFVHRRIEEKTSRKNKQDASKFSTSHDHMIVQATPVDAHRRVKWVAWEHSKLGMIQPRASTCRMGGVGVFRIGNNSATPMTRRMGGVGAFQIGNDSAMRIDALNGWHGCIPNWERFSHIEWVAWVHSKLGRVQPHKAGSAFGDAFLFGSGHRSRSWASLNASRYLGYS